MTDWPVWVWVIIVVVLLAVIAGIVMTALRRQQSANLERAEELRTRAHESDRIVAARQERADELAARAEAVRNEAIGEGQRAEVLRRQAAEAEERAARAAEQAELSDDEALHSRESLEAATLERDQQLKKADQLDPRAHTGRHGHSVDDEAVDEDRPIDPDDERDQDPAPRPDDDRDVDLDDERDLVVEDDPTRDDVPRDEHGRRLDPYGNPIPDGRWPDKEPIMTTDPLGTQYPDPAARPDLDNEIATESPASPDSPDSPTSPDSPPEGGPLERDGMDGMDIEHEADADGFWRDEFGNRVDHEGRRVDEDGNRVDAGGDRIDPVEPPVSIVPPIPR